jgi:hypothetical protein
VGANVDGDLVGANVESVVLLKVPKVGLVVGSTGACCAGVEFGGRFTTVGAIVANGL